MFMTWLCQSYDSSMTLLMSFQVKCTSARWWIAEAAFLTRQREADGGWLQEEGHTFADRHGDADGAHHHEEEAEDGHKAGGHAQTCRESTQASATRFTLSSSPLH